MTGASKSGELLDFVEQLLKKRAKPTWIELHNAVFGIGGKAGELFPTESERAQLSKTEEYRKVMEHMNKLQGPAEECTGNFMVRGPRSLHKALIEEAKAEGVSLNQLCVSKLSMQLRSLVH